MRHRGPIGSDENDRVSGRCSRLARGPGNRSGPSPREPLRGWNWRNESLLCRSGDANQISSRISEMGDDDVPSVVALGRQHHGRSEFLSGG